jgi:hypothetical protein
MPFEIDEYKLKEASKPKQLLRSIWDSWWQEPSTKVSLRNASRQSLRK